MKNIAQELSDSQLDAISGGCCRYERPKCSSGYEYCEDDYSKCEPKHRGYEESCRKPRSKEHCKSPWERWSGHRNDCY